MRRKRQEIREKEHTIPWPSCIPARITNVITLLYGHCALASELEGVRGHEGWLMRLVICFLSYEI
jgi:hypothetical protein